MVTELISEGRTALESGDWEGGRRAFSAAVAAGEDPRALEGLGETLWWLNELEDSHTQMKKAYLGYRAAREAVAAARVAIFLARDYLDIYGNFSAYNGWLARADTLLREADPCAEEGWLLLARVRVPTADALVKNADDALRIARATGDIDLEIVALAYSGTGLIWLGRRKQGMTRLDEAMAAVTAGEVGSFFAIQEVYCKMLAACDAAADFKRAQEWCLVAEELSTRRDMVPLFAMCRAFYGGFLTATGRWREAESALISSLRAFERSQQASRFFALIRLAELRVRQGRFEEAEQLLKGYEDHPDALGVLVSVNLIRNNVAVAATHLERLLAMEGLEATSKARHLAALVVLQLRRDNLEGARKTAAELIDLAKSSSLSLVTARAEWAAGRVAGAAADEAAVVHLRRALEGYAGLGMPFEIAQIRLEIARILQPRDADIAAAEARTAHATFEQLGAAHDADAAAALLREFGARPSPGPRGRRPLTKRESEVLNLLGFGLSNPEIAQRLYLSRKTVESHVSSILAKLSLRGRAEAVAYALAAEKKSAGE